MVPIRELGVRRCQRSWKEDSEIYQKSGTAG
jgi:hypothetical protein